MKKTLLVILSVLLVHGLAACGGGGGTPEDTTQDEPAPEVTHDPDAEATPQEEAVEVPPDIPPIEVIDVPPEMDVRPETPTDVPPANGVVGDGCVTEAQCGGVPGAQKQCLTSLIIITFDGGYCSATCTTNAECDATVATCVTVYTFSYCLKRCDSPDDCRTDENYTCGTVPGATPEGTYCIPNIEIPEY